MDTIRVIKIEPHRVPEMVTIEKSHKAYEDIVGGWFQTIPLSDTACIICNDSGKLLGLEGNRRIGNDAIAGTFIIVGLDETRSACSLSPENMEIYMKRFRTPERISPKEIKNTAHFSFTFLNGDGL